MQLQRPLNLESETRCSLQKPLAGHPVTYGGLDGWLFGVSLWVRRRSETSVKRNKNIFNHQVFHFFFHATVKQQQIQQQLEAVSCHYINCNTWMSSKRQTRLLFFCIFKFTLHFSLVFCEIKNIRDVMWFCASDLVSVCYRKCIQFNYLIGKFIYYF